MLRALWTATARALAAWTALLAVALIVVSIEAARAEGDRPAGEAVDPGPSVEALVEAQAFQPVRASSQNAAAVQRPAPAVIYAAPKAEALPATRASAVSGQSPAAKRTQADSPGGRRLVALLDVGPSPPPQSLAPALLAKQRLEAFGYDVTLLNTDASAGNADPPRPDAYVALRSSAEEKGAEAWFCQVEGSLGGQLAEMLLKSLPAVGNADSGAGDGAIGDREGFNCGALLGGRARMPTVLLEIPDQPDAEATARGLSEGIRRFFEEYRALLLQEDRRQRLVWPAAGAITSPFGPSHPLGIDIGQWKGPVVAATDGVVLFAGGDLCCSYGLYVVLGSADGIITLYAHLESIVVKSGQRVRQGEPLGMVGCTGRCFGNHLHFEVIEGGARRNPLTYLP